MVAEDYFDVMGKSFAKDNEKLIQQVFGKRVENSLNVISNLWKKEKETEDECQDDMHKSWDNFGFLYYDKKLDEFTYICEPYTLNIKDMKEIIDIAEAHNLHVSVRPDITTQYPGKNMAVIFQTQKGFYKRINRE